MIPFVGMPEPILTTGLVTGKSSNVEVTSVQVSSPSFKDRVDYSRSDLDWDNVRASPDSRKFSHLTEKDMPITAPETELPQDNSKSSSEYNSVTGGSSELEDLPSPYSKRKRADV